MGIIPHVRKRKRKVRLVEILGGGGIIVFDY